MGRAVHPCMGLLQDIAPIFARDTSRRTRYPQTRKIPISDTLSVRIKPLSQRYGCMGVFLSFGPLLTLFLCAYTCQFGTRVRP